MVFTDGSLSDASSFIIDPVDGRWFFRYHGSGVFGSRKKLFGAADASTISSLLPAAATATRRLDIADNAGDGDRDGDAATILR